MGARESFGVEPPIISGGKFEGQFFILKIVFSYIEVKAIFGDIVEGFAGDTGRFIFGASFFCISGFAQFVLQLGQIFLAGGNIEGVADGFQIINLCLGFCTEIDERFISSLQLIVTLKILFCVCRDGEILGQRDRDFLAGVIIQCLE